MSFTTPWTDEQNALLRVHHAKGCSFSIIADEINKATGSNLTRSAVAGRVMRMSDLPPRVMGRPPAISRIRRARSTPFNPVRIPKPKPAPIIRGDFLHIGFFDLKPNHCRYPDGEGWTATYCGQPKIKNSAFCAYCHSVCYERPEAREARYAAYLVRKFAA